jgi:NADH-quinone oxidoreductase subunit L
MMMDLTTTLLHLVPLVVLLPVAGLLLNLIAGSRLGEKVVGAIASTASGLAFVVSVLLGWALSAGGGQPASVPFANWIAIGQLNIPWTFRVDSLSVTMMLVVSGVGTLIHIYAIGYMHEDVRFKNDPGRFRRFFVYLNLFIALMMVLVSGDSYLMLFVGWEGVGLCSYLLIGFWFEMDTLGRKSLANALAAKKAMIANRIGDFGFLLAAMIMFWAFKSLTFEAVFSQTTQVAPGVILAITLFLLVGVTGKSAQLPLYVWLPDAMAGPTPVSALIHAATMVTAGVYLVARSAPLYSSVPAAQTTVALVGGITALFAATIAVGQYDIKKVLAYSTISQLGFMVAAVGMGAYVAGMFHLVTHAFFKALLFLSAGSVILGLERGHHALSHSGHGEHGGEGEAVFDANDMRNMGGLRKQMPVTFWVYLAGTLALAGIVPWAGFWSKDEILAEALQRFPAVFCLLLVAAFFTAFYMGRQVWMVFFGEPRHAAAGHAKESPKVILVPLIILAVLATLGGAFNLPVAGARFLTDWLGNTIAGVQAGEFNFLVAGLSTLLALVAIGLSWLLYGRRPLAAGEADPLQRLLGPVFKAFERKYWVDEGYAAVIIDRYVDLARFLAEVIDARFWHDWFHDTVIVGTFNWLSRTVLSRGLDVHGIDAFFNGLGELTKQSAAALRRVQNGFVRSYALAVLAGVVIIIGYLILK